jgi:hypothetical protein
MEAVRGHLLLTNCLEDELTESGFLGRAAPGKAREKAPG